MFSNKEVATHIRETVLAVGKLNSIGGIFPYSEGEINRISYKLICEYAQDDFEGLWKADSETKKQFILFVAAAIESENDV